MKKWFLLALAMVALQAKAADTLTVRINGMRCSECGHKVKNILRKNPGVGAEYSSPYVRIPNIR